MEKKDLRIVYMGTPDFAVESLRHLIENNYNVVGVITMPDKPSGRGHKIQFSPVKEYALSQNLPLLQPEKLKNEEFEIISKTSEINSSINSLKKEVFNKGEQKGILIKSIKTLEGNLKINIGTIEKFKENILITSCGWRGKNIIKRNAIIRLHNEGRDIKKYKGDSPYLNDYIERLNK